MRTSLSVAVFLSVYLQSATAVSSFAKRAAAYYDPRVNGGSMLDVATSDGLGEPLNVRSKSIFLLS